LFILAYVKTYSLQVVQGRLFGMGQSGVGHMTVVLPQVPCYTSGSIIQDPLPEERQLHPAIATLLDQLQAVDVAFDRPV
jgi:hypothetical protein